MEDECKAGEKCQLVPVKWKAISLTHVEYPSDDPLGYLLAWSSLLPIFTIVVFISLIVSRRDLHTISYFCGMVFNEVLNMLMKNTIKEPRPKKDRDNLYTVYGMPSSHSQFMGFLTIYLILFLVVRLYKNSNFVDELWKYAVASGSILASCIVGYSRFYLGYHTIEQILYGYAIGATTGLIWFYLVHCILTPNFPSIAGWSLCEYFMVRDSSLIPNVMWFEYTATRSEARARQRKITQRKSS